MIEHDVLESNIGYHIVKILEHKLPKILALNEPINPENPMTVKQYISQILYTENQQNTYTMAVNDLIKELKEGAEITILL